VVGPIEVWEKKCPAYGLPSVAQSTEQSFQRDCETYTTVARVQGKLWG